MLARTVMPALTLMGCAVLLPGFVPAETYYVDQSHPRASDENAGTEALPWKTINHAATVLRAGDTVLVKEGTYNVGTSPGWAAPAVGPARAGTKDSPITLKAFPGHPVTITTAGGQAAIGSNRDYVVWDGFTVDMTDRMKGIIIFGAKGCVVRYCEVRGNYIASGDNHDGIRIERAPDCRIHHNVIHGVQGNSPNSAGIKVYGKGVKGVIVEDNYIYDNVFDGKIELHAGNTGTDIHDNLFRCDSLAGAWAGGVVETMIWNNIVISKARSITACENKRHELTSALAYTDYNVYDAPPVFDFGQYTPKPQRFFLHQMQSSGFEQHSHVVASRRDVFDDDRSYRLLPKWKTSGRDGDAVGPRDIAQVLDVSRYGPGAIRPSASAKKEDQ